MKHFLSTPFVIILLAFFVHAIVKIGGEVTPSFLFILALCPIWLYKFNNEYDEISKTITRFYIIIIVIQLIWAFFFSETDKMTQIKGVMVTVSGLLFFLFYYPIIKNKPSLLKWYFFGEFIASFFFIDMIAIRENGGDEEQMWKFQIFPRIVRLLIMIYLFLINYKIATKIFCFVFFAIGMLGVTTGARSAGLSLVISGIFTFFSLSTLKKKAIKYTFLVGTIALYLIYSHYYVPRVLDGRITSGNSEQLLKVENPHNPFNLLIVGRPDSFVPFYAFFDKPLTGWGLGTSDPDYKYHNLLYELTNREDLFDADRVLRETIPGHSVWGSYSCNYGMLMFLTFMLFIGYICKVFYHHIASCQKYRLYCFYLIYSILWTFLFSPYPILKTTLSINIAFLLAVLMLQKNMYEK